MSEVEDADADAECGSLRANHPANLVHSDARTRWDEGRPGHRHGVSTGRPSADAEVQERPSLQDDVRVAGSAVVDALRQSIDVPARRAALRMLQEQLADCDPFIAAAAQQSFRARASLVGAAAASTHSNIIDRDLDGLATEIIAGWAHAQSTTAAGASWAIEKQRFGPAEEFSARSRALARRLPSDLRLRVLAACIIAGNDLPAALPRRPAGRGAKRATALLIHMNLVAGVDEAV